MEWPSKRVAQGGIFQPARVNYSPETKKFLQELIQETRLTTEHRNKLNYCLRSGEPLPSLASTSSASSVSSKDKSNSNIIIKQGFSKRRDYKSIRESGAYDRDRYIPLKRGVDREYAKKHLQDFMAFGKEVKEKPSKVTKTAPIPEVNRFDQIKEEIQERMDWLSEMEKLGEGHKYRILIEQQIAARMREMAKLEPSKTE